MHYLIQVADVDVKIKERGQIQCKVLRFHYTVRFQKNKNANRVLSLHSLMS